MNKKVPVLFIIFNRPDTTEKVFNAIRHYQPEKLYIASDGPRESKPKEKEIVDYTRQLIINSIDWDCKVKTLYREKNLGCGYAVSGAITWFFKSEEMGIIIEDDCLPNITFFQYCEELLIKYKDYEHIALIGGNNFQSGIQRGEGNYYFSHYPATWGWASWSRAWKIFDHNISFGTKQIREGKLDYAFNSKKEKKHWLKVFINANKKKDEIWDYHFCYAIWQHQMITITPNKNLVVNIGMHNDGTHYFLKDSVKTNAKSEIIYFPLIHPAQIKVNRDADIYLFNNFYRHSFKRAIRLLKENDLISIIRYIKSYTMVKIKR
jgi:hypothetical protein